MHKSQVQALYQQVKKKKQTVSPRSLFRNDIERSGCKTCGKVTWRPNQKKT